MSAFTSRSRIAARGMRAPFNLSLPRPALSGVIIVGALLAFELFNYSTTEFALRDLLGDLTFRGLRWATILALAFCGMDFAGVTRMFSPVKARQQPVEVWYLLAAWLLAATMNAMLTWWAVSLALLGHQGLGNAILGQETLMSAVPVFVALLVWLIRVLMIGTFTLSGSRLLRPQPSQRPARGHSASQREPSPEGKAFRPAPKSSGRSAH